MLISSFFNIFFVSFEKGFCIIDYHLDNRSPPCEIGDGEQRIFGQYKVCSVRYKYMQINSKYQADKQSPHANRRWRNALLSKAKVVAKVVN